MKFQRRPRTDSIEITQRLEKLRYDARGRLLPDGQLSRGLLPPEQDFIDSELLLCKLDFEYYFTRYHKLELDPGVTNSEERIAPPILLESQHRYITCLGRREEECHTELKKYGFTTGINAYVHKVRQVTATATFRGATIHRMRFWPGTRCMAASLDEDRIGELFTRDRDITYENYPFWMKPSLGDDVKNTEFSYPHPNNSRISYQAENQKTGIGTGSQVDVSHLTEVGLWANPGAISFSFWPGVPKAITTLHVQESTSAGRGYWSDVTEAARHKKRGYENWIYIFIPWYMNKLKYRANVPDTWMPSEHTVRHAKLIERTSPEFMDGITYRPNRSQLYWWESERTKFAENGELHFFLANYPATPEQSFQNPQGGALPVELLEIMEQETMQGRGYDLELAS